MNLLSFFTQICLAQAYVKWDPWMGDPGWNNETDADGNFDDSRLAPNGENYQEIFWGMLLMRYANEGAAKHTTKVIKAKGWPVCRSQYANAAEYPWGAARDGWQYSMGGYPDSSLGYISGSCDAPAGCAPNSTFTESPYKDAGNAWQFVNHCREYKEWDEYRHFLITTFIGDVCSGAITDWETAYNFEEPEELIPFACEKCFRTYHEKCQIRDDRNDGKFTQKFVSGRELKPVLPYYQKQPRNLALCEGTAGPEGKITCPWGDYVPWDPLAPTTTTTTTTTTTITTTTVAGSSALASALPFALLAIPFL